MGEQHLLMALVSQAGAEHGVKAGNPVQQGCADAGVQECVPREGPDDDVNDEFVASPACSAPAAASGGILLESAAEGHPPHAEDASTCSAADRKEREIGARNVGKWPVQVQVHLGDEEQGLAVAGDARAKEDGQVGAGPSPPHTPPAACEEMSAADFRKIRAARSHRSAAIMAKAAEKTRCSSLSPSALPRRALRMYKRALLIYTRDLFLAAFFLAPPWFALLRWFGVSLLSKGLRFKV